MDGDAFDRTFSLDALGTAMAALAKMQQEAERLKASAQADLVKAKAEASEERRRASIAERERNDWQYLAEATRNSTSWRLTAPLRHLSSTGRLLLDVDGHGRRIAHLQELVRTIGLRGATSWALRRVYEGRGSSPSSVKTNADRVPGRVLRRMTPKDFFAYLEGEQAR